VVHGSKLSWPPNIMVLFVHVTRCITMVLLWNLCERFESFKMVKNPESRIKNQESNPRYFSYHQSVWDESVEKSLKGLGVWSMYWFRKTTNQTKEVKLSLFETTLKRLSVGTQTGGMFRQLSLTRSDLLLICILTYQEVARLGLIWCCDTTLLLFRYTGTDVIKKKTMK
jgi:hypothetical protein